MIRQFYFPLDTRVRREVDALLDAGHEVEVFCLARAGEPLRERRERLAIWRVPLRHRRARTLTYALEHAAFLLAAGGLVALRHLRRRFDVVQANSLPDTVVFAALVPRLAGARVLLDLHECAPEFMATRSGRPPEHPLIRLTVALEQASIRFADRVVTCTEPMRRAFAARGADPDRIAVVHNAADERIFAAGDVARVLHAGAGRHLRIEQWQPAQEQGRAVAASMLGLGEPYRDVPWMWSDQHDLCLQAAGFGFDDVDLIERGALDDRAGIAFLGLRDGRLVAACGLSQGTGVARTIRAAQILIEHGVPVAAEQLADATVDLRKLARAAVA